MTIVEVKLNKFDDLERAITIKAIENNQIPPAEINVSICDGVKIFWNIDLLRKDSQKKEKKLFDVNSLFNVEDKVDEEWAMRKISSEPIIITKGADDKFEVLDGKHRLYKAKMCGQKEIEAYFFTEQELEKYILFIK